VELVDKLKMEKSKWKIKVFAVAHYQQNVAEGDTIIFHFDFSIFHLYSHVFIVFNLNFPN